MRSIALPECLRLFLRECLATQHAPRIGGEEPWLRGMKRQCRGPSTMPGDFGHRRESFVRKLPAPDGRIETHRRENRAVGTEPRRRDLARRFDLGDLLRLR